MADYVLSAKGTYDGSDFDNGVSQSKAKLQGFMDEARSVGQSIKSALGDGIVKTVDGVTKAIGDVGAGVVALAATGGIKRALNLEQAEHLFDGIGLGWETMTERMDATTGKFMTYKDIVNEAVSDTQFSLDEAAVVAANLGAAGVKSGDQLAQALDAATGIASTFGADLADVGGIFQKVAAQGKVTGDNIFQMSSRGINALDALAQHYNVTQEEAQKMVSAGEVSFQDFSDAMTEAFGGKAKTANDTFVGSLANVKAALSRIGAKFATPGLDALKNIFNALRPLINAVSAAIDPLVAKFTQFLGIAEDGSVQVGGAVDKLVGFIDMLTGKVNELGEGGFTNLSTGAKIAAAAIGLLTLGSMGGLISQIPIVGGALGGLFGMLSNLATPAGTLRTALSGVSTQLGLMSAPMLAVVGVAAALAAAFVALMITNEDFRNTITGLIGDIGASLAPAFQSLQGLLPAVQSLFQSLMGAVEQLAPAILGLVAAIAPVVSTIVSSAVPVIETLMGILGSLVGQITGLVTPVINKITALVESVMPQIQSIITTAMNAINTLIQTVWPYVQQVITAAMNGIQAVIEAVWPLIETIITNAMNIIQTVIEAVSAAVNGDWGSFWNLMGQLVTQIWEAIKSIVTTAFTAVQGVIVAVLNAIKGVWDALWGAISAFVLNIWNGIQAGISGAIAAVQSVITSVVTAIQSWWNSTWNAILSTVSSIWNGITSTVSGAASSVQGTVSGLVGAVTGFFGSLASSVASTVSSMWSNAVSAFTSGAANVISAVQQIPSQIQSVFSGAGSWLVSAGSNIVQGLISGIQSMVSSAVSAAQNLASSAVNAAKGALGIHSPSRVFRDQVGKNIALGIADGVSKNTASATKSMEKMCKTLKDKALGATKKNNYEAVGKSVADSVTSGISKYTTKAENAVTKLVNAQVKSYTKATNAQAKKEIAALNKNAKGYSKKKTAIEKKAKESIKSYTEKANKVSSSYATAMEKASGAIQERVEKQLTSLSESIQDKYDAIADLQEKMRSKLVDYSTLYDSQKGAETLADLKKDLKAIKAYGENMESLKGKISEDLLAKVADMDVADGKAYSDYLLGLSKKELAEYDKVYSQIVSKSNSISKSFYAEKVKQVQDEYANGVNKIFADAQSDLEKAGMNALNGFVSGISKSSKKVDKAVSKLATSLVKNFKKSLGIKSPSRVLRDQVGKYIPLGLAAGIDKTAGSVADSVRDMTGNILSESEKALRSSGYDFSAVYDAALNMGELDVHYNTDAKISGMSGTEEEVSALRQEVLSLRNSLGRIIADNAPVVTETERQAARRYRRAQYA